MDANELRLDDGFSTLITLANIPTVKLYEREVTPPPLQGGGPIETTTMRNTAYRTAAPKKLKALGQMSATCAYATSAIPVIQGQIGVNQPIIITYPDQSTLSFWGWLDAFTPGNHTEGAQPTANVVFHASNRNDSGEEVPPAYNAAANSSGA